MSNIKSWDLPKYVKDKLGYLESYIRFVELELVLKITIIGYKFCSSALTDRCIKQIVSEKYRAAILVQFKCGIFPFNGAAGKLKHTS